MRKNLNLQLATSKLTKPQPGVEWPSPNKVANSARGPVRDQFIARSLASYNQQSGGSLTRPRVPRYSKELDKAVVLAQSSNLLANTREMNLNSGLSNEASRRAGAPYVVVPSNKSLTSQLGTRNKVKISARRPVDPSPKREASELNDLPLKSARVVANNIFSTQGSQVAHPAPLNTRKQLAYRR